MKGELVTIRVNGATTRQPLNSREDIGPIKEAVGGGFELVSGFERFEGHPCDAYVHDEGVVIGLPPNRIATEIWWDNLDDHPKLVSSTDMLCGSVAIVIGDDEFMRASLG